MDVLSKLFGSTARVKIMRLFLLNPKEVFDYEDLSKKSKATKPLVQKEVKMLESINFVTKIDAGIFLFNENFILREAISKLLIESDLTRIGDLPDRFKEAGNLKMLVLSGIFMQDPKRAADILIVGDKMEKQKIQRIIQSIESEVGRELRYCLYQPEEFQYRLNMHDTLMGDIFQNPYIKIYDELFMIK